MKYFIRLTCIIFVFGLCASTSALTWYVPIPCPTIQAGIDSASTGDTVLVTDGTYTGDGNRDIDFDGKAILVTSENGPLLTIIDCEGDTLNPHRGFYFHNGEDTTSVVRGFTIQNGGAYDGGGIHCDGSSPTIEDNIITGNTVSWEGGGIYCGSCSPLIKNNTITGNYGLYGGGIYCEHPSSPTIKGNTITGNTFGKYGGGIYSFESSPIIIYNTITGNTSNYVYGYGGGILCEYDTSLTIDSNTITENTTDFCGGGIACYQAYPSITRNIIIGNESSWGGGIYCEDSSKAITTIEFNTIMGNIGEEGGGICCWRSSPTIAHNAIIENQATWGGGIYCEDLSSPIIDGNTNTKNTASNEGGGIYIYDQSSPTIINSIFWEDSAGTAQEIYLLGSSSLTISYSDVEGGSAAVYVTPGCTLYWEQGNINTDPLFVTGSFGDYYLSQTAAGQTEQSPCVDAGDPSSSLPLGTTRTDGAIDMWPADMGYHYPVTSGIVEEDLNDIHQRIKYLHQNYPNPFISTTTIKFLVITPSQITLSIYNICGALVRRLVDDKVSVGIHEAIWDGRNGQGHKVSSGVYLYRLEFGDYSETRHMIILR